MMGYMDRTWCPLSINQCCARSQGCYRAFTKEDEKRAIKWWGDDDFPICVFSKIPNCFVPISGDKSDGVVRTP